MEAWQMNILAMDLGKSNTVVCYYDSQSGKHHYEKIKTSPQQIHDVLVKYSPDRLVFEVGALAGWVQDIAVWLKIEPQAANTSHQAWRWKNVRKKNDRTDALKLARLSAMNQLPLVHIPGHSLRQKRALIRYRQNLIKRRTQIKNSIRAIIAREGLSWSGALGKGWSRKSLERLSELAGNIEDCAIDDLWKGQLHLELRQLEVVERCITEVEGRLDKLCESDENVQVLRSIDGVGRRLAEAVAAFLDEPDRFKNGKQVGSYVGLTPRQYQSGSMNHQGRISGAGNDVLRALLVEVSWLGLRYNKWMRETYHRILRGSASRKKIAITAVARKLIVRCWAMMRDKSEWREDLVKQAA
jgi:transposase